jgi:PAS domain S-box-containing protein
MFANLQSAYAELAQAQFELQTRTAEIAETRDLFARVIASMSEALFLTDQTGEVIRANAAAGALLGRDLADIEGRPLAEVTGTTVIPATPWQLLARAPEGALPDLEADLRAGAGLLVPVNVSCTLVRDTRGKIIGMLVIGRDVTQRRRAERERAELLAREQAARREAEEANRAKDLFLATLSHELRTPLNAMFGWVRLLRMKVVDAAAAERALEAVERNARLQMQLVEDLLDVSRVITGKMELDVGVVDVVAVVEGALDTMRAAATAKAIQLEVAVRPVGVPVVADARRLLQVVWNLVSNAVKFTPNGGRVRVEVGPVDGQLEIAVTDSGIGISEEFLPFVFERFRQADSTSTRTYGGLGLGLAIVRHLVELHGGTVTAESAGPDRGATFRVRLPLSGPRVTEGPPASNAEELDDGPRPLEGLHVLVVDDTLDDRELVRAVLETAGASVTAVESAPAARSVYRDRRPDLVISDIAMPREDGYQLIETLRRLDAETSHRPVPAIALTATAGEAQRRRSAAGGFERHLVKPFAPDELVRVIVEVSARR